MYVKEAGETQGGERRPNPETGRPKTQSQADGEPPGEDQDSRPRKKSGPKPRERKAGPRLTAGLPHRQRRLSALTPEELNGREPGSRGAHYSSGHEGTQKVPGASETGSKTFGSHLNQGNVPFATAHAHTRSEA